MAFLELRHVNKGYGRRMAASHVLADINLEVERGEFVAIVGYSGAGKTTLINMMAGLSAPDSGTLLLDGKPITGPGADRGVVFQNYSLLPWLTSYENVYLAVDQTFPELSAEQKRQRTERHLAMVNLTAARDKKPAELSGGMKQRVAVARALAVDPQVLLMDEPLGALDALTRATIQEEIGRIWERSGTTVVLITNDVDEGILLADRIIPLSMGPRATLGPAIDITIPRPRDRKAMNHNADFKHVRNTVIEYLLGPGRQGKSVEETVAWSASAQPVTA
jgi:nitrate/nitrite transport system ATP-binding protein